MCIIWDDRMIFKRGKYPADSFTFSETSYVVSVCINIRTLMHLPLVFISDEKGNKFTFFLQLVVQKNTIKNVFFAYLRILHLDL